MEGHKEVLGMWVSQNEGAKFWLSVVTELVGGQFKIDQVWALQNRPPQCGEI
jgi:transposase-like protein